MLLVVSLVKTVKSTLYFISYILKTRYVSSFFCINNISEKWSATLHLSSRALWFSSYFSEMRYLTSFLYIHKIVVYKICCKDVYIDLFGISSHFWETDVWNEEVTVLWTFAYISYLTRFFYSNKIIPYKIFYKNALAENFDMLLLFWENDVRMEGISVRLHLSCSIVYFCTYVSRKCDTYNESFLLVYKQNFCL